MNADHEIFEHWAAAYVLSALEPDERAAFMDHLDGCDICQNEIQDFAPLPGLFAQLDLDDDLDDGAATAVAATSIDRARRELVDLEQRERRWRNTALGAIAAAILLVAGIGANALSARASSSAPIEVAYVSNAEGVVLIGEQPWGTEIELDLVGLDSRPEYRLWTVDNTGDWQPVMAWNSPPGGLAKVTGGTLLAPDNIDRLVISSTDDRTDVVLTAEL